jgi:hypothetical protein
MKDTHRQTGSWKAPIADNASSTSNSTTTLVVRIANMAILIIFPVKDGGALSPSSGSGWKHSNARTRDRVASSEGSCVNQIQSQ